MGRMEAFTKGVAAPNWEMRLSETKELPESVCTCGSVQFSLLPRLYLPCPNSCCGLVTPWLIVTDITASSEPWEVKHLTPTQHLTLGISTKWGLLTKSCVVFFF